VKWIALLLLCSCAPAVTAIPSSLPYVRVDATLPGAVMSRDAAIVVVSKRIDDKKTCDARVTDCETRTRQAEYERDQDRKIAKRHAFWGEWGPTVLLTAIVSALAAGFAAGFGAAPRR
jgi:hypothetical protein